MRQRNQAHGMKTDKQSHVWNPIAETERLEALDVMRGLALFGVLMVNLLAGFRVSLFEHILTFHTHPGWTNHVVDVLTAWLLEFKAFTLFSFLFGVGVGVQAERTRSRAINLRRFLARRFLVLFVFGVVHILLIWNGDILTLYAICGLLLLPLVKKPVWLIITVGVGLIALTYTPVFDVPFPTEATVRAHAAEATGIYAEGSYPEILVFRWRETREFIAPLLINSLPKTYGLMLLGIASWRVDLFKRPSENRGFLLTVLIGGGVLGAASTTLLVLAESTGVPTTLPPVLLNALSYIPLAFAIGAGLLLWLRCSSTGRMKRWLAGAGRMALSNYLAQSVIFSVLFYGYGLGLFGRLGSAQAALVGVGVFLSQLWTSDLWLRRYRYGPAEWLWRSLTYGSWQPIRRTADSIQAVL